ncbi:MAG: hypothetical protein ACOC28_02950 [Alkalispirochaetaceae bacterium]
MSIRVEQCYWRGTKLVVETTSGRIALPSGDGIKALKRNVLQSAALEGEERSYKLFSNPENPRRFRLLQQALSLERD